MVVRSLRMLRSDCPGGRQAAQCCIAAGSGNRELPYVFLAQLFDHAGEEGVGEQLVHLVGAVKEDVQKVPALAASR